jgi:hypothetical protein
MDMADDDSIEPDDDFAEEPEEDAPAELDEDELDVEGEEVFEDIDDEFVGASTDEEVAEEEGDDDSTGPVRRAVAVEEDDEDDDLLAPDDVEADLDTILKDRLVSAEDEAAEDEEEEVDDRAEPGDRLQPKRADEQLCPSCFLLVRQSAPGCPVGDDVCPLFA